MVFVARGRGKCSNSFLDRSPPPVWGRIKVGGRSPRYGVSAVRCLRPGTRTPPTLTLPHNGGRENPAQPAGVRAPYKVILSTHHPGGAGRVWAKATGAGMIKTRTRPKIESQASARFLARNAGRAPLRASRVIIISSWGWSMGWNRRRAKNDIGHSRERIQSSVVWRVAVRLCCIKMQRMGDS